MSATTLPVPSPLRRWLAAGLFVLLAFGVCWTGAILYWRARGGDPGTVELLVGLLVLPGTMLAAGLLAYRRTAGASATAALTPAQHDQALPTPTPTPEAMPLAILATTVRSPHGTSVAEIADGLASKRARPALDAALVDEDGFPLMTARCPDADDSALAAEIAAWLAANGLTAAFTQEQWRALVLATGAASELADRIATTLPLPEQSTAVIALASILPDDWSAVQRDAGGQWLRHTVAQSGWPIERIAIIEPDDRALSMTPPFAMLTQFATHVPGTPVTAMLIAAASHVGDTTAQTWAASGSLFTSGHPQGKVPGEGAIALLLTDVAQAQVSGNAPFAVLHPVASTRRAISADEHRGPPATTLGALATAVLAAAQVQADAVATIVADTGLRTSRMLELMGYASAAMPQLDNETEVIPFGRASGACGAVPALTALALASHYASERASPVLWLAHDDPFQCCAAVVNAPLRSV